ncbi:MAG: Hpt domain-containing protein [Calditrichaceae bacterium]|nr:Hpt domain-containing protein [Calditrichaceae bacterium]
MHIKRNRDLTFTDFFLLEFFNQILEKGKERVEGEPYKVLHSLSDYMTREADIIPALEKLARLQGTNELSIFLFDMVGRIEDYSSEMIYATLPDLADDFVNLYGLMVEDEESAEDLHKILAEFEEEFGTVKKEVEKERKEKETVVEEKPEVVVPAEKAAPKKKAASLLPKEKEWITIEDFYTSEFQKLLQEKLGGVFNTSETKKNIKLITALDDYQKESKDKKWTNHKAVIVSLLKDLDALQFTGKKKINIVDQISGLEKNVSALVDDVVKMKDSDNELYTSLIKNGISEEVVREQKKAAKPAREEVPEKPVTIDNLLMEYFKSEVDDHLGQIEKLLSKKDFLKDQELSYKQLIRQLKSLKEISMIHGYGGMEYGLSMIINKFEQAADDHLVFTGETVTEIKKMLKEFGNVDKFTETPKNDPQIKKISEMFEALKTTFETETEKAETAEIVEEEATEPEIIEADEFMFSDKEKINPIAGEILGKLSKALSTIHVKIDKKQNQSSILSLIDHVKKGLQPFFPEISDRFLSELGITYQYIFAQDKKLMRGYCENIDNIWAEFFNYFNAGEEWQSVLNLLEKLRGEEKGPEENLIGVEDLDIGPLFADTHKVLWQEMGKRLEDIFILKNASAVSEAERCINHITDNLSLIGYDNYLPGFEYLKQLAAGDIKIESSESVNEFVNEILARIKSKGKSGDADDLLTQFKARLETVEEAAKPEEPAIEPEDEVESIFKSEFIQHMAVAREALKQFSMHPAQREALKAIEQSIHSIKTAAQILNKNKFPELTSPIEDIAELFGKSTIPIPEDLPNQLENGLNELEILSKDPDHDIDEVVESLNEVLDQIMIEDIHPESAVEPMPAESPVPEEGREDTLFIEKREVDQELVSIFEQEAEGYLKILKRESEKLGNTSMSDDTMIQIESSAHSLKAAAKMMGFRDIAKLSSKIEDTLVSVKRGDLVPSPKLRTKIGIILDAIIRMSKGGKVSSNEVNSLISDFDVRAEKEATQQIRIPTVKEPAPVEAHRDAKVDEYFFDEASQIIQSLNEDLLEIEKIPESVTLLANLLRNLHTIKGSSMMMKLEKTGSLCHKLEDYFELYKTQRPDIKETMISTAFQVVDVIEELINKVKNGEEEDSEQFTNTLAEIDNKLFLFQNFESSEIAASQIESPAGSIPRSVDRVKEDDNFLKVTTTYIDNLVNMATDLVVNRTELSSEYNNLKRLIAEVEAGKKQIYQTGNLFDDIIEQEITREGQAEAAKKSPEELQELSTNFRQLVRKVNAVTSELERLSQNFEKNIGRITNLSNLLHNNILRVRMVPVEYLFDRFSRPVRDLAHSLGKKVDLVFKGSDTEMDKAMVEALVDPILHILRNAVDHGIETEKERKKLNKNLTGQIILQARRERNQVVIDITDDGRGIDIDKVKKEIVKRKLEKKKKVEELTEAEVLDYLFYPEFSTSDKVSKVSGRGIGMDVVASHIQKLKGNIRIKTAPDEGTTFSIRVPLTLVISQAIMTKCRGQSIAIPASAVQQTVAIEADNMIIEKDKQYIKVRDKLLPYLSLDDVLNFEGSDLPKDKIQTAIVLHDAGVSIALGIPGIDGRQEIIIKALGSHLQNVEFISGGTILGNGEVALILDCALLIRAAELQFFGNLKTPIITPVSTAETAKKEQTKSITVQNMIRKPKKPAQIKDRKPIILVVDDSVSVRKFVSSILEKHGFDAQTADSGALALESISKSKPDLVITDLEMPNMDGFTLITEMRDDKDLTEIPIIILTGKSSDEQQKEGMERGADAYITKPFKEEELIRIVNDYVTT